ncbi:3'-5' exonuclease [Brachyspira pilosicoli]|uniref:3'-5' exonuclease n=1 Tax=Brachyspira pilosicoli TaxID=52584 RepID=UPI002155F80F|nr:3'-5' exonuclease [Brachyspira pilosicoli]
MKFADALGEQIEYLLKQHFNITKIIELQKNYRLEGRENISNFQKNIRNYDKKSQIELDEDFQIKSFNYFEEEISFINNQINKIISKNKKAKIAILFSNQFYFNDDKILNSLFENLTKENIEYINILKTEKELNTIMKNVFNIATNIKILNYNNLLKKIKNYYDNDISKLIEGYKNYCLKFGIDFNTIIEVLKEKDLIKYAPYCSVNVNILNIHKAKGAEWDYVFIPFLNKKQFIYKKNCNKCNNICYNHIIDINEEFYQAFYVAITRTKYGLYITSTKNNASCLFYHSLKLIKNIY